MYFYILTTNYLKINRLILLKITLKQIRYLGINATKEVKDLSPKIIDAIRHCWKKLSKIEIKQYPVFIDQKNVVKTSILPKSMYRLFNAIPKNVIFF